MISKDIQDVEIDGVRIAMRGQPQTANGLNYFPLDENQPDKRILLELCFNRIAPSESELPAKRAALIQDVCFWLSQLSGADATTRDEWKGIKG